MGLASGSGRLSLACGQLQGRALGTNPVDSVNRSLEPPVRQVGGFEPIAIEHLVRFYPSNESLQTCSAGTILGWWSRVKLSRRCGTGGSPKWLAVWKDCGANGCRPSPSSWWAPDPSARIRDFQQIAPLGKICAAHSPAFPTLRPPRVGGRWQRAICCRSLGFARCWGGHCPVGISRLGAGFVEQG